MDTAKENITRVQSETELEKNKGSFLFRLYIIDADTDPDDPIIKLAWKRGDEYTAIQKRVRAILKGDGLEGDFVYTDDTVETIFEVEEDSNWFLAQVRKQKSSGKPAGIDKEWVKILLANENLSAEEKLAQIAKYT